jgi:hypothetical protein
MQREGMNPPGAHREFYLTMKKYHGKRTHP